MDKLCEKILKSKKFTIDSALKYAAQVAKAFAKAHDQGIIHRNVKPSNIMINQDGQIKVMDFGHAKMAGTAPIILTGATVGTMTGYMAPEQIDGKQFDHRVDLFSLGVVLF